jgi:ribonuclease PH
MSSSRHDGRQPDQLRPISFIPHVAPHAAGSVLVSFGNTRVICAATIHEDVPRWMKMQKVEGGWLTAEYSMLPYSTLERKDRDISRGKLDGRSSEIQRLIGRALRAVTDLTKLGQRTIWIDCDVLQADGGTRTASITGGCVALAIALNRLMAQGKLKGFPLTKLVSAISAGVVDGKPVLDLDYIEDKGAAVDFNVVMTESGELAAMLDLATKGSAELVALQRKAILEADRPSGDALASLAAAFGR